MATRRSRAPLLWLAVVVALAAALAIVVRGCGLLPTVCPAIGYSSGLIVDASGLDDAAAVARVCVETACGPTPSDAEPVTSVEDFGFAATGGSRWSFASFGPPESVTVRVFAASCDLLGSLRTTPQWIRIDGSPECGGDTEARITLRDI